MGTRTQIEMSINAGFEASLEDTIFQRDVSVLCDTLDHASVFVYTLDGDEALVPVSFGDVTEPRLLYIEAEGDIDVRLWGSGGQAIEMRRPIDPASSDAATYISYLLFTGTFTSIHLTNDTDNSCRVRILIVGDLVAA